MNKVNYVNSKRIPLILASMLTYNDYDATEKPENCYSVTDLIKSPKQFILGNLSRASNREDTIPDVKDNAARMLGQIVHAAIYHHWLNKESRTQGLLDLGFSEAVAESFEVNTENPKDPSRYISMEQRNSLTLPNGVTVTGKPDIIAGGRIQDIKVQQSYSYIKLAQEREELAIFTADMKNWKADDLGRISELETKFPKSYPYIMQGSMYRVICTPEQKDTDNPNMDLLFLLKDWSKAKTAQKYYPEVSTPGVELPLLPMALTTGWMDTVTSQLMKLEKVNITELPACSNRSKGVDLPVIKFYGKKTNNRATKVFTGMNALDEAVAFKKTKGDTGYIATVYGDPALCGYCSGNVLCNDYFPS